ncbi:MAG: hypothetical protein JWO30_4679 [Fibrobacteres bacterium]|nr:hypothetical protein [Fibrobacterota bacterium]
MALQGAVKEDTAKTQPGTEGGGQYSKQSQERERRETVQEDLRQILLVDSVAWIKMNAIRRGDQSLQDLQRERVRRKKAALAEFCLGERLASLAEVDSLKQLSLAERATCKDSLKKANPLLP